MATPTTRPRAASPAAGARISPIIGTVKVALVQRALPLPHHTLRRRHGGDGDIATDTKGPQNKKGAPIPYSATQSRIHRRPPPLHTSDNWAMTGQRSSTQGQRQFVATCATAPSS